MTVTLESVDNEERSLIPARKVKVNNIPDARRVCQRFISDNNLDNDNWGANAGVVSYKSNMVGQVSYSGRYFSIPQ